MSNRIRFGEPIEPEAPYEHLPPASLLVGNLGELQNAPFQVYITQSVYAEIWGHINQTPNIESGGVLAGYPFRTSDNKITFVVITAAIPQHSDNRSVRHFTVGPAEINAARLEMEQKYPGLIPVGWYHSHPGHGIFLSSQDMTIVRSIYNISWHIAMVIDPLRQLEGIFVGSEGTRLGNDQLRQNWLGLQKTPASIEAIALYNRAREAMDSGQLLIARQLLEHLQDFTQSSKQLRHWRNGYRDTAELQKQIEHSLAENPQLNDIQPLLQPAQLSPSSLSVGSATPSPLANWWLWGAGLFTLLFAVSLIAAILYPQITGPLFMLGSVLVGLLAVIVAGYVIFSQNISSASPDDARQHKSPVYSETERIGALILILLVILILGSYAFLQTVSF